MTRKHFRELVDIVVDNQLSRQAMQDIMSFCMRHNRRFCEKAFMDALDDKGYEWGNLNLNS